MRVFVYEYCCAVAAESSLRKEGWAMLSAIVQDLCAPNIEVVTLLASGCASLGHRCERVAPEDEPERFRRLAREADVTLVIAPETSGILAERSRWVIEAGGRLLGCEPATIELTADKRALAEHFSQHGVPTPALHDTRAFPGIPVVLKPRDGAGSQATFLIRSAEDWQRSWRRARAEMPDGEFLVQTYVPGLAASVVFLTGPNEKRALVPAAQHLSDDGRFRYLGGRLPLPPDLAKRATVLATRAISAIPGLAGPVGVDVVLADDPREDVVIEINPRLTTSYLGLRRLAQTNLAGVLLEIGLGKPLVALPWGNGIVEFHPDDAAAPATL